MLAVLRHFQRQGVAMVNGPVAIEAVADKLQTLQLLSRAGLPIPKTILGKFPVDVDIVERELGFPVVVKTLKGTRGNGVLLCNDRAQFNDIATLLDGARPGKLMADIYELARIRLAARGVTAVHGGGLCTVSDERFFSYRRTPQGGRFASLVWLAPR